MPTDPRVPEGKEEGFQGMSKSKKEMRKVRGAERVTMEAEIPSCWQT